MILAQSLPLGCSQTVVGAGLISKASSLTCLAPEVGTVGFLGISLFLDALHVISPSWQVWGSHGKSVLKDLRLERAR